MFYVICLFYLSAVAAIVVVAAAVVYVLCGLFILFVYGITFTCWWLSNDNAGRLVMLKDAILVPKPPPEIIIPPQKDPRVLDLLSVCLYVHMYMYV